MFFFHIFFGGGMGSNKNKGFSGGKKNQGVYYIYDVLFLAVSTVSFWLNIFF